MTTYLERAAGILAQRLGTRLIGVGCDVDEAVRIVAEAFYPETPEPERIEAMARAMHATNLVGGQQGWPEDGCATCEVHCEAACAAERKLVLGL